MVYIIVPTIHPRVLMPPAFIVTATVAEDAGSTSSAYTQMKSDKQTVNHFCSTIKSLKIKRSSCAVCGATRSTNGGSLSTCSKVNILNHIYIDDFSTYLITLTCFYQSYKCESVSYCCREHQLFHWKKGGHKQQCSL